MSASFLFKNNLLLISKTKYGIYYFVFTFTNTMTMLRATSVQDAFCYDNLIRQIAGSFEKNHSFTLRWESIKRQFRVSWSRFCYDVIMEINSRVFSIKQGALLMVTFSYEQRLFGDRYLIPLQKNIPLW